MPEKTYAEAIVEAIGGEMRRDENVVVMGLDVKQAIFGTTRGLYSEFGPTRIIDTPVCEASFVMAGVGAAMTGLRPVVETLFGEYMYLAMDSISNMAASWPYVSNGVFRVPLVVQTFCGARGHGAYSHSQSTQAAFINTPGIKMVCPSSPADAKGLMTSAIRDDTPVLFYHHRTLLAMKGEVPDGDYALPLGRAEIVRPGRDVTLVSFGSYLHRCLDAAEALSRDGLEAEVIDLRTLVPFDEETVAASVKKTTRLVVVEDGRKRGGIGSEIAATIAEQYIDLLDGPIVRVAALDTPVPFSAPLEQAHLPQTDDIIAGVRSVFR
ncbi:MAG: alpha-ketoacid dehydrogenase subunit beta [Proteobacteria bacterium]|nr:alpha-ketoacid dehydrogenase subunit beta [Pseudomonadota bacterium]